jgi:hypothetical protein
MNERSLALAANPTKPVNFSQTFFKFSSTCGTLVLKYKDGEKTIIVPPDVVVVTFAPATIADLKPGEKTFVAAAAKQPDGMLSAPNITVGRNGVNPPM